MAIDMHKRMFFVIGSPRSGTTLLMRMLNVHQDIYTRPEPHLLTPLAHLGYWDYVDKAPYDQFQAHQSVRQFVAELPAGEQDHIDALRAYTDIMYGRMLEPSGKRFFLDKTPAYALVLPFIQRIYPDAVYVVLTRHPFAIFSSFAKSFFDNDWQAAHDFNPIIERYVPAIAAFLRDGKVPYHHVRYESLVADPEAELQGICTLAEMAYDPSMIDYGKKKMEVTGLGDPIGVSKDTRPNTKSVHKWALEVVGNDARIDLLKAMVDKLDDDDLEVWGYTRESLWAPLAEADAEKAANVQASAKKWDRYALERRVLKTLRKDIQGSLLGNTLGKVRFYCDVLLRE